MIHDLQGRYVVLNKAVASYVGMAKEDLIGMTESEVMDGEAAAMIEAKKRNGLEAARTAAGDPKHWVPDVGYDQYVHEPVQVGSWDL